MPLHLEGSIHLSWLRAEGRQKSMCRVVVLYPCGVDEGSCWHPWGGYLSAWVDCEASRPVPRGAIILAVVVQYNSQGTGPPE